MLKEVVIKVEDLEAVTKKAEENACVIVCQSNTGLKEGLIRLTLTSKKYYTENMCNGN